MTYLDTGFFMFNLIFNFYDKSLEVTEIILKFATNSVCSFVWVIGLFTIKDVTERYLWSLRISQI